jgi:FAD:protein FMN transferase
MSLSSEISRAQPLLGTIVEIRASGLNVSMAIDAAFSRIKEVQRLMSFHEANSDVTRINQASISTPITIDPQTYQVLTFAIDLSHRSEGAFDITVGGALVAAGFLPQLKDVDYISCKADFRNLKLLPDCQVMVSKPVCIDLGGIAKGYAVDVAIEYLRTHGIDSGLVNAGGDLRFFGQSQIVHIRHPHKPNQLLKLEPLADSAVASSSGYYSTKFEDSREIDPLVDPEQGVCQQWAQGITVIAPTCMVADALTKVVRLSSHMAPDILQSFEAQAIMIDHHGAHLLQGYNSQLVN